MKKTFIGLGIALAVLLVLSFFKDFIIKFSVERGVEAVTGLPLGIKSFRAGVINTIVDIKGLKLSNPKGYKDRTMLDSPEIYVDYDLPAVLKGTIHLEEARINVKEFVVIKNEKGQLNIDALKSVQEHKKTKKAEKPKKKGKAPSIKIDTLELKIGKAVFKDYSRAGAPLVKEFNININERYSNITDPNALVNLIVVKAMMNTTIANLANFNTQSLQSAISDTLDTARNLLKGVVGKVGETGEEAGKTAVKGVGDILDILPFGGEKKE